MLESIYRFIKILFDTSSTVDHMVEVLTVVMDALEDAMNMSSIGEYLSIFKGLSAALIVIFFYIHCIEAMKLEMLTIEKLLNMFFKMIAAVVVIMYLDTIMFNLLGLGRGIYSTIVDYASDDSTVDMIFLGHNIADGWPPYADVKEDMEAAMGSGPLDQLSNIGALFILGIPALIKILCDVPVYFVSISSAIKIIYMTIYAPIAVVQLFEDGSRANGIRYLKSFTATAMTFGGVAGVLYGITKLNTQLYLNLAGSIQFDVANLKETLTDFKLFLPLIGIQVAGAGAVLAVDRVMREVVGV